MGLLLLLHWQWQFGIQPHSKARERWCRAHLYLCSSTIRLAQ